jgi:hypothetical protein
VCGGKAGFGAAKVTDVREECQAELESFTGKTTLLYRYSTTGRSKATVVGHQNFGSHATRLPLDSDIKMISL